MKLLHRRTVACLIVTAALSGCAGPQTRMPTVSSTEYAEEALNQLEFALKREVRDEVRLWNVGKPILVGAAELCEEKVRPYTGLWALNLWNFGALYQSAARKLYGLDQNLRVAHMLPGSPAAEAGLIAGDIVLSAGGLAIPRGEGARDRFYQILETYGRAGSPIEIKASRGGQTLAFRVVPGLQCDYPMILRSDDEINAYADGRAIYMTQGIMRFTESDQHLAVAISHELAHNVMGHIEAKKQNATVGALGGLLLDIGFLALGVDTEATFSEAGQKAGAEAYSVEFEQEADYVGLYFLARAGFPLDGAGDYWRLSAANNPLSIILRSSHPTAPERFVAIEKTIEEIKVKRAMDQPLVPEYLDAP